MTGSSFIMNCKFIGKINPIINNKDLKLLPSKKEQTTESLDSPQ